MFEFRLIHVVLVLSYANALGVDLDEFCEGIHETTTYGDGTTYSDILIRELVAGNLRGGIDGGTIFADDKTLNIALTIIFCVEIIAACEDVADEVVGFARGCAIANGDGFNLVFLQHLLDSHCCLHAFVDRRVGEDGLMMEQIALRIKAHHLTTSTETRIDTHHPFLSEGCAQQQLTEILRKHADGLIVGLFLADGSKFCFNGRLEQTLITVLNSLCH